MKTIKIKADGKIIETTKEVLERMDFFRVMFERWTYDFKSHDLKSGDLKHKKKRTKTIKVDDSIEIMRILVNLARYGDWKIPDELQDIVKERASYYGLKLECPGKQSLDVVHNKKLTLFPHTIEKKMNFEIVGIVRKFCIWGNETVKTTCLTIRNSAKETIFYAGNNSGFLMEFDYKEKSSAYFLNETVLSFLQNFDHLYVEATFDDDVLHSITNDGFYLLVEQ